MNTTHLLTPGDSAPHFSLPTSTGQTISLSSLKGKSFVLYFYPKANTSGCTKEACAFEEALPAFKTLNIPVIGVSRDPMKAIMQFAEKYNLTFPLASDEEGKTCMDYGVWVEKSMYGRKYMGIERSTFLIGPDGKILQVWYKVKIPGHVEAVMKALSGS
ncbi:thioredoxin-dependent thiol peroxidase [Entomobacter blattae]|uniref:thioredoxin-dependent peroxiredoxin n=1 Tax=Entomobacter blattae TaxID=2762277 RepID=A0A7H1NNI0_9PROT|nr:thioredoxin-dependent thiol peroxidase [Entomobacter blattae]QNT77340.1 Putative peroxiredoxin bcp [Entomobacter blattae]